jgi:hypothetical protein
MHDHLLLCSLNNKAYQMGMDFILRYGLKCFLNKFKRKGHRQDYYEIAPETSVNVYQRTEAYSANGELISLLSEMIQAVGTYHGTEPKNYN